MKPIRVVIVALVTALLLTSCLPGGGQLENRIGPDPAGDFVRMTNTDRVANGLPALRVDSVLTGLAQEWAARIAQDGYFHHRDLEAVLQGDTRGYTWLAENIGNVPLGQDVFSLEDLFVHDVGHRANMLDTRLNIIGAGCAYDSNGVLLVVVDFAGVSGG